MSDEGSAIVPAMGRRKKFDERCVASFVAGTFARIDAVLPRSDDRTDFIRDAVEDLLRRREREAQRKTPEA